MRQAILDNSIIHIKDFELDWYDKKITCQCCDEEITICRGMKRQYFRHKKGSSCAYSEYSENKNTQSIEHILCKEFLYLQLLKYNSNAFVRMEYPLTNNDQKCIADVYAEYSYNNKKFKYAFEIQKSAKTEKSILAKNNFYKSLDIIPIWISWKDTDLNRFQTNQNVDLGSLKISGRYKFNIDKNENTRIFYEISNKSITKNKIDIGSIPLTNFRLYGHKIFYLN